MDPAEWARWSAAAGARPVDWARAEPIRVPCINYEITPRRFQLDIPVEALANLTSDGHTRMLAMLNAWITEHTPPKVKP